MAHTSRSGNSPSGGNFLWRAGKSASDTLMPAFYVIRSLLVIMLPVSFAVLVLETSGVLYHIAAFMDPLMRFLGLPGEAALVFLSSVFLNIYSAIAVIKTLALTGKQMIILATMCLIAHDFFVECLVMKKTGSSVSKMVIIRLVSALLAAWILFRIVPDGAGKASSAAAVLEYKTTIGIDPARFLSLLLPWFTSSVLLIVQVLVIVFVVMFFQRLLDEFGIMKKLGRGTGPAIRFFGLPENTAYVWIIGCTVGVAYGSGVLIEEVREGKLSRPEADLFNHHAALNHSQIEDTLLFVSIGVPYLWAALPRLVFAVIVVWLEKMRRFIFRRSFRVKVM
jgi:spore maturation protein SpmB